MTRLPLPPTPAAVPLPPSPTYPRRAARWVPAGDGSGILAIRVWRGRRPTTDRYAVQPDGSAVLLLNLDDPAQPDVYRMTMTTCTCKAGLCGRPCKHTAAMAALTAEEIPMDVSLDTAAEAARIMKAFLAPWPEADIKIKPATVRGNRCLALHYLDARHIQDRLDETVGINGWQDAYTLLPTGEVECRLSVRVGPEWITKADVGGQSEQPDDGDRLKAAYSDALKRAAVKFGIGRFLYRLPQQWMDYDPAKKQIIRPAPAPTRAQPRPAKDAPDNPDGRTVFLRAVADAPDRLTLTRLYGEYEITIQNGNLGPGDKAAIDAAFQAAGKKFPKPAK